jgi:hypothetical protein
MKVFFSLRLSSFRNIPHLSHKSSKYAVLNRRLFAIESNSQPPRPPPDPDQGKRNFRSYAVSGIFCAVLLYIFTLPGPPIEDDVENNNKIEGSTDSILAEKTEK